MFVVKYRPKSLKEFVNQKEAVNKLLKWMKSWKPGKALLFYGPAGVGKTCLVEAYALQNDLQLIQMNASDFRSKKQIEAVFGSSMLQQAFGKKSKIFLIDEIDGLAGRQDVGGVGAIIKIIKQSRFPVILTANDPYDKKLSALRQYCTLVQFKPISVWDIERKLEEICRKERIKADKEVLRALARRSKGDLRAAINDLEVVARGKKEIKLADLSVLSAREKEENIFNALKAVFKTSSLLAAKLSIANVDMDPDTIFWWIENNITNEYEKPEEIAKAYEALALADLFGARIRSRQNWKLLGYQIDLMTGGVAVAKHEMYRKFTKYQYPSKIIALGRSKGERKEEKARLEKLSKMLHCSTRKIKSEFYPYLRNLLEKV